MSHDVELVLLPGLDGTGHLFWRLLKALPSSIRVRVISYPNDEGLGYAELADLVSGQIGGHSVVLLGESFSGPIAVDLAVRMAGQVRGLILAATFLKTPRPAALVRLASRMEPRQIVRPLINAVLKGSEPDGDLEVEIARIVTEMPSALRASRLREVARVNVEAKFAKAKCPVLVVHGKSDWLVPRRPIERAVRLKPHAEIKVLAGPHMLLQRNPVAAARAIEIFLGSIGNTR